MIQNYKRLISQLFLLITCTCWSHEILSQRFSSSVILGANFAQIDGDDFAGFNKLGLSAGLLSEYELKKSRTINIELLFNQAGSKSTLSFGLAPGVELIRLNYIDIPILFRINDWEIEERFFKVYAEGGLNVGRLFNTKIENSFFNGLENDFTKTSIGFVLGGGIRITKNLAFTGRYSRSINSLYKNQTLLARSLFGYFLTFRLEYKL